MLKPFAFTSSPPNFSLMRVYLVSVNGNCKRSLSRLTQSSSDCTLTPDESSSFKPSYSRSHVRQCCKVLRSFATFSSNSRRRVSSCSRSAILCCDWIVRKRQQKKICKSYSMFVIKGCLLEVTDNGYRTANAG